MGGLVAVLAEIAAVVSMIVRADVSHLALVADFVAVTVAVRRVATASGMMMTAGANCHHFDLFPSDLADRAGIVPGQVDAVLLLLLLVFAVW